MKLLRFLAAAGLLLCLVGCFKMEVNVPSFGGAEGRGGKSSPPSQLPSGGGWKDIGAGVMSQMLAAEDGILLFGHDTLAYPKEPVVLAAKIISLRAIEPKGIKDVTLGFYYDEELIGAARTDENGQARITWTPPEQDDYEFTVGVIEAPEGVELPKLADAPLLVAARKKDTPLVVIDLDHTLVQSSFVHVLLGTARPMPDSVRVTRRIAKKYGIVYLTDRPDLLSVRSKQWLRNNGYPPGPVLLSTVSKLFSQAGQFKTSKLSDVRKAYPKTAIGIGDKTSDAQAYVDNGMTAYLIPHYKDKPSSLRDKAEEIDRLVGRGRLNVVSGWKQIEAGIFAGKKFPPGDAIRRMLARAEKLEAQKRERERRKHRNEDEQDD